MAIAGSHKPTDTEKVVLEAWSQGFMLGALVVMCGITLANMRKEVLLHRLILIELVLAVPNCFFMFFDPPAWGWFLSSTVVPLIASWTLHNFIAWMKNKPFLKRRGKIIYLTSILLAQPYWILEIYANFAFFNGINNHLFIVTRPYEAAFRDPWWIFTIGNLFWNIKFQYQLGFIEIVQASPRFGILLGCMCLSVVFIIVDILSVTPVIPIGVVNPFWKFAFVFKCFTDSIILDDFKTALDKLYQRRVRNLLPYSVLEEPTTRSFNESRARHSFYGKSGRNHEEPSVVRIEAVGGHDNIALSDVGGLRTPSPVVVSHRETHRK